MLNNNYWVLHNAVLCAFIEVPMSSVSFPPSAMFFFSIFIIKVFYLKSCTEHPCTPVLGCIPKYELKQCQAVGKEAGCPGCSCLHV